MQINPERTIKPMNKSTPATPRACTAYNNGGCNNGSCPSLHICFGYIMGSCKNKTGKCLKEHNIMIGKQNQNLIRKFDLFGDGVKGVLAKIREGYGAKGSPSVPRELTPVNSTPPMTLATPSRGTPRVCMTYNNGCCTDASCQFLHVCFDYIMGSCNTRKCPKEHNIYQGNHNIEVLRKYDLLKDAGKKVCAKIRESYGAGATAKTASICPFASLSEGASGGATRPPSAAQSRATLSSSLILTDSMCCEPFIRATTLGCTHTCEECVRQAERRNLRSPLCRAPIRSAPEACMTYNTGVCKNVSCPFLHVCFDYIMDSCNTEGKCHKEHNIMAGKQNREVLGKFNLLGVKGVFTKIREGYVARAMGEAEAEDIEASEGASGGATRPPSAAQSSTILPARLTCAVCFEPFIRATTLGCTHTFCEDCVRQAERRAQPCPLCRAPITTSVGSLVIDDTVSEWFDGQDEETQRGRRQLETERRRAAAVP